MTTCERHVVAVLCKQIMSVDTMLCCCEEPYRLPLNRSRLGAHRLLMLTFSSGSCLNVAVQASDLCVSTCACSKDSLLGCVAMSKVVSSNSVARIAMEMHVYASEGASHASARSSYDEGSV